MGAIELRNSITDYLSGINDTKFLRVIKVMVEEYKKEEIIDYTIDGKPLTKEAFTSRRRHKSR